MFKILSLIFVIMPISTFASTNGGGVLSTKMNVKQAVFSYGQNNGTVRFAHGQFDGQNWKIENVEMPESELLRNDEILRALTTSKAMNTWIAIK